MPPDVNEEARHDAVAVLDDVTKSFTFRKRKTVALDGVSLAVRAGRVTGLVGPDGAGKTTLMRLLVGLLRPDRGHLTVLNKDVAHVPLAAQRGIGYMPQRFGLYEDLSVEENLALYADLQGVPEAQRADRYHELESMTGLGAFRGRLAGALSGGMKQKLGLACALIRAPKLLVLDEPTVGVDPVSRRELWAIIYRLVKEGGAAVLLSTAYLDEAERCDTVVLLHKGVVLGQGTPSEFSDPMHGRSYLVTAEGLNKRILQNRLSRADGVVDAAIQMDGVRVVMQAGHKADGAQLTPDGKGVVVTGVAPRFEDRFVAMLREAGEAPPSEPELKAGAGVQAADETVIEVEGMQRRFGDFYAVKGIGFTVRRGEVFGLLGANGAGKTTAFRMLCGLLPATEGRIEVAGRDLRRAASSARARIGYMAQRFSLYTNLSVKENLRFFSSAYNLRGARQRARIAWALEEFGLQSYADSTGADLPLGFKQRLALAAALMHEPDILFLDEPTSGVDPLARREFWQRINALAERGVTVLVTTHFMEEADYCDRLVIMAEGEVLAAGTPKEMRAQARTANHPHPTMEDAFVHLIKPHSTAAGNAAGSGPP